MSLPPLKIPIDGDLQGFNHSVAKAKRTAGSFKSNTIGALDTIATRAKRTGGVITGAFGGIAGVAGAFSLLAGSAARAGDKIDKASQTAGLNPEFYQEAMFAMGQLGGIAEEKVGAAFRRLTRRMGEAENGNKTYLEALSKVGISQQDLATGAVTTEEAFDKIKTSIEGMETATEAASLASKLFGDDDGPALAAALRENVGEFDKLTDKAHELGIVLSDDFVQNSAAFTDASTELQKQLGAVRAELANKILPVLTDQVIPAIQDRVIPALISFGEKIGDVISWFQGLPEPVQNAVGIVAAAIGTGGPILIAIGVLSSALKLLIAATGPIGLFIAAAGLIMLAWRKWGDEFMEWTTTTFEWIKEQWALLIEWFQELPERFLEIGRNIISGLLGGVREKFGEVTGAMKELGSSIVSGLKGRLGIKSPSRVMMQIGRFIGQGLARGIDSTLGLTSRSVSKHAGIATQTTDNMATSILGSLSSLFSNSKPLAIANALISTYQGIAQALRSVPFPGNLAAAAAVGAKGFAAVASIRSTSKSGGGGSGVGGGGARGSFVGGAGVVGANGVVDATGGAPAEPEPVAASPDPGRQQININLQGDTMSSSATAEMLDVLFARLKEGAEAGYRLPEFVVNRS